MTEKLEQLLRTPIGGNADLKGQFLSQAASVLRRLAVTLDLPSGSFDLRTNPGGVAVSGEVTLHCDVLYVQISQSVMAPNHVLYRSCDGREDYTGGVNHFCRIEELFSPRILGVMREIIGFKGDSFVLLDEGVHDIKTTIEMDLDDLDARFTPIETTEVESSNVNTVAWENDVLTVSFKHGGIYDYFDVPRTLAVDLVNAESAGKFLNAEIKSKFEFKKR